MIERTKAINNPLTLFAIFAGIPEISFTCAIGFVNNELQYIFIWFVIGFPILLLLLFFLILIFKPGVLYAPSDFKDEQNFLISTGLINKKSKKVKGDVVTQMEVKK